MRYFFIFQLLDRNCNTENITVLHPTNPWDSVSRTTRRTYKRIATKAIEGILSCLAPQQEQTLWNYIRQRDIYSESSDSSESPSRDEKSNCDIDMINSAMLSAPNKRIRTQILSVIAHKHSKSELISAIPGVTKWQVDVAREHAIKHSPGDMVPAPKIIRNRMSMDKATHFINFISQRQFVQDVAYGTTKIKLKSGEKLELPKVIRTVVLGRLIKLYLAYCMYWQGIDYKPSI